MDRICRTCLHSIPRGSFYFQLDGQDLSSVALLIKSQLQACVPEMRVGVIKNPVLCSHCLNALTSAYKFKTKCLETEKQILDYVLHVDSTTTHVDINLLAKRLGSNSIRASEKYETDVRSESPSLLIRRFHSDKISSSKKCKAKFKKGLDDSSIIENIKTVKKSFINDDSREKFQKHENLARLMTPDIKMEGPLSKFISIDDISASIINGIIKEPFSSPQFTIKTILGECIEINNSDEEEIQDPEMLLPNNNEQLTVSNNEKNAEESFGTLEDYIKILDGCETFGSTDQNPIEFKILETPIPSCDNIHISLIKPPETKKNKKLKIGKHFKRHSKSKYKKIKKKIDVQPNNDSINTKEICSRLVSVDDKNSLAIERLSKTTVIAKPDSKESASSSKGLGGSEDCPTLDIPENGCSINNTKTHVHTSIHPNHHTITENIPFSDINILKDKVGSPEKRSNNDLVKDECDLVELPTEDEWRAIRIKDEVIIKDESEFQQHKSKFQELRSNYSHDVLIVKELEPFFSENTMEVDELQQQSEKASTLQQFKNSCVLNRTLDDDVCSTLSYREARRGCYSCAVCSYSCNSESILVSHTKIHANKSSYKYADDLRFCGFSREDLQHVGCIRCKYAKSDLFLTWLKPEVVLSKCNHRKPDWQK